MQVTPELSAFIALFTLFLGFFIGRASRAKFNPIRFNSMREYAAYLFTLKMERIMAKDVVHTAKVPMIEELTNAYKTILTDKEFTTFDNI